MPTTFWSAVYITQNTTVRVESDATVGAVISSIGYGTQFALTVGEPDKTGVEMLDEYEVFLLSEAGVSVTLEDSADTSPINPTGRLLEVSVDGKGLVTKKSKGGSITYDPAWWLRSRREVVA